MKVINFAETNSVLNQYVAEIRDVAVQGDRMRFRRNIERIGEIMAYEMSKELTYSVKQVQTPLGVASVSTPPREVELLTAPKSSSLSYVLPPAISFTCSGRILARLFMPSSI